MGEWSFKDCEKQDNGKWLCWDNELRCFVEVNFTEVSPDKCDPRAVKRLVGKIADRAKGIVK
jgi:hypothetical protein